jgi:hypothetical protein
VVATGEAAAVAVSSSSSSDSCTVNWGNTGISLDAAPAAAMRSSHSLCLQSKFSSYAWDVFAPLLSMPVLMLCRWL